MADKQQKFAGTPRETIAAAVHKVEKPEMAGESVEKAIEREGGQNSELNDKILKEEESAAVSQPLEAQLNAARQEAKEHYERLLRVSAEFENFKKRSAREMQDFRKYANESLLKELLSVVDNLERAICSARVVQNSQSDGSCLVAGVEMVHRELLKVLDNFAVKPVEALGQPFDPAYHQAMMQENVSDQPANIVLQEFQKGYMIHDRLLRPAMVVVSKNDETT